MKDTMVLSKKVLVPLKINAQEVQWLVVGGGTKAFDAITQLLGYSHKFSITVVAEEMDASIKRVAERHHSVKLIERTYEPGDLSNSNMIIIATGNKILDEKIHAEAKQQNLLVFLPSNSQTGDFSIAGKEEVEHTLNNQWFQRNTDKPWKSLATKLIWAFVLMVVGYIIISYLPLPPWSETWRDVKPFFDYKFLFFVVAGFLAQMVDGMLSMGYGVTSATCLMSFGVSPVSVSAAIHTSEIFTTGVSGYSQYTFGNVNKKLFKHLVVPGVVGAVLGALMLVFLGEKYGNYLMPVIALYAGFLGLKILIKAFQGQPKTKKIKRLGWLAGLGGFFDSFGGGGWGPIVTSSLISKGRSPKYTVGSVSLTEFFVTLSSAFTFFITVGVSHWNVVLGLLIGGSIAAPIAARFAGKLPRKTMMILVGIMVMIWCVRMFIKSVF
jgi:uncharacterized membrane protein YfcA